MNGLIAQKFGGANLPLKVIRSAAGYYIGTEEDGMPYSRESMEYWTDAASAQMALESGDWSQIPTP